MVFVVERYLPGLSHSELLRGLANLERGQERHGEAMEVRYLGSTVVLKDEACFCQFEGPTEAAVAEANRKAGLPFDRIVSAVTVRPERRTTMNVSATIPATVQIRRSRLLGLIGGVAAVAAAVTWAVLAFGVDSGSSKGQASAQPQPTEYSLPIPSTIVTQPAGEPVYLLPIPSTIVTQPTAASQLTESQLRYVRGITSLSPLERAAAFGGPSAVLDALQLDRDGRRYVEGISSLSRLERAAAFGGPGGALDALQLAPESKQYVEGITSLSETERAAAFGQHK
jgi:Nickel responsive protein SCO4226-like